MRAWVVEDGSGHCEGDGDANNKESGELGIHVHLCVQISEEEAEAELRQGQWWRIELQVASPRREPFE